MGWAYGQQSATALYCTPRNCRAINQNQPSACITNDSHLRQETGEAMAVFIAAHEYITTWSVSRWPRRCFPVLYGMTRGFVWGAVVCGGATASRLQTRWVEVNAIASSDADIASIYYERRHTKPPAPSNICLAAGGVRSLRRNVI